MKALNEGVVEQEHDCCEPPRPFLPPEDDLTDVANVLDLGMSHTKLPYNERGVEDHGGNKDCKDQAGNQSKGGIRVWERHDGQANVFTKKQRRSLSPTACSVKRRNVSN